MDMLLVVRTQLCIVNACQMVSSWLVPSAVVMPDEIDSTVCILNSNFSAGQTGNL